MSVDLDKIQKQIEERKKELGKTSQVLGESKTSRGSAKGRDQFLSELMHSAKSGVVTEATAKVAAINKVADAKANKQDTTGIADDIMKHVPKSAPTNTRKPIPKPVLEDYGNVSSSNPNQTLADALSSVNGGTPNPMNMNATNGMLSQDQMQKLMEQYGQKLQTSSPSTLNEEIVMEKVSEVTSQFLNENFSKLFSDSLKQTIVETYKAERVKEALNENRDIIKSIVIEVIRDLKKPKK
jgi:hypothetical protein